MEYLKRDLILGIDFPTTSRASVASSPPSSPRNAPSCCRWPTARACPPGSSPRPGARAGTRPAPGRGRLLLPSPGQRARLRLAPHALREIPLQAAPRTREAGLPDGQLVSHQAGTTGIVEKTLRRLLDGRKNHQLTFLDGADRKGLLTTAGLTTEHRVSTEETDDMVRFAA
ncbi:hypothetical protein NKH77_53590 [Streptomyces sp. M19]